MMGLEGVDNRQLADGLALLRRLWRGEKVVGHDGPLGKFPYVWRRSTSSRRSLP
jgi:hypothetical protein